MDTAGDQPGTPRALTDEELLAAYLRDRDVRCVRCRYNLRGVNSVRCPECGQGMTLAIAESTIHGAYWYAALSAFAWPLLLNGMIAAVWVIWLTGLARTGTPLRDLVPPGKGAAAIAIMGITLASMGGIGMLLYTRNRPWRPRTRRIIVVLLIVMYALHAFWLLPFGMVLPSFMP